ncbi:MAG: Gfo/Idh/MocA family oxidoreductase [Acidimicrobiia bacterium]|nr:Gfo/Idh/MocA family oxidoreductase [bacterium]MXZ06033.1 Gfo/Idh/MocA family oxidoreductase [Acidimicrobiia bacterium]MYD04094.1 Gfo/Idh/MocA family oxidoreductase [Acidimicrobiia bacterium]
MKKTLGIGLVGFGWMGQAHSRSYRSIPLYFPDAPFRPVLAAVADTIPHRISQAVDDFGYETGTRDWREIIDRPDIDVIDITAPNTMHQEVAEAAAAAGKHIFCEKPVGISTDATAHIEAAARKAGVISGCGYNYRWAPLVRYTKELVEAGRFGSLTHYRGRFFTMYGRDRLGVLSWRFLQDEAGYGALSDIMTHAIDMAHFLVGPIRRVVATRETFVRERPLPQPGIGTHYDRGTPDDPTGEVTNEDYVGALVEFANGTRGTLEADRSIFGPQSQMFFELNGSRGAATWNHEKLNQLLLYLPEEQPQDGFIEVLGGDSFYRQANLVPGGGNSIGFEDLKIFEAYEFLDSVAAGRPHNPGFEAALANASVAAAMIRSWKSDKWETVESLRID